MTTESAILSITPLAAEKLSEVLAEQNEQNSFIRIIGVPGGHGGVQYMLSLEKAANTEDTVVDAENLKFLVDADSKGLVEGVSIDYVDGLMRSGFTISNPNFQPEGGGCGCGAGGGGCGCGGGGGGGCGGGGGGCGCGGH